MANVEIEHYFWLISNLLIFSAIVLGISIVALGIRRTKTLKTGAGPWIIIGLLIFLPSTLNEILDELFNAILQINVYPPSFYEFVDKIYPPFFFIGGIFLIYGLYRQFLIGEKLSLKMYKQNVELSNQKKELSYFANSLAHDLRSEISVIIGFTDLLSSENQYNSSYVEEIKEHVDQISVLLNRSVELADAGLVIDKAKLGNVDLNKLVNEVAKVVLSSEINFLCITKLPVVTGDREKLYQVFKNLFENAVIHGNPKTVDVMMNVSETEIMIRIRNDGNQIPFKNRNLLFQKDFTTKSKGKGIGLTIISKIVNAHGWTINLDPDPVTTFCIRIPLNSK